nr:LysR family transcriptional regulator [uncultured Treponema sp.]
MELRVLKYFIAVAREESMTRAADILHVTQPTLSKQIKDLEDEIGKKLFNRTNYAIKLTAEGEILYKRALDIVNLANDTVEELKAMTEATGGNVNIGAAETDSIKYLARIIKQLQQECAGIIVSIYSGDSESVEYKLDKGQLDFALVVRDFDLNKYNFIELPYKDTFGLICRSDNPLCKKKKITFDDMINEPIIVSRQSLAHDLRKWAGERVDELTIAATGDIPFNLSLLVKEGIGSLLCFDKIINTTETSNLRYIPLDPPMLSPLYIIWKKNAELTPPARKLMERFRYLKL